MFIILSYFFSGRNIIWIRDRIVTLILIHPPPLLPLLSPSIRNLNICPNEGKDGTTVADYCALALAYCLLPWL